MIEVYLFLAAFPVQILAMSVFYPAGFSRLIRSSMAKIPAERLAELYPGVDVGLAHERFLVRYRVANVVVIVIGLTLLGWFIVYMRRPAWDITLRQVPRAGPRQTSNRTPARTPPRSGPAGPPRARGR